jgi:transketolase
MRTRFFTELAAAAAADPDIVLITGDVGYGVVEQFAERCPGQFLNAGVAEQNMTGLAAGIALAGGRVFTYSIANFPTLRCLEQIRNDVAYHHADVTAVAVGGGLSYGALGMSHHATEDLAIMRAIPGLAVAAPGDPAEAGAVMADLVTNGGPAYLRLGKTGESTVHAGPIQLCRGESIAVRTGGDIALFSTGTILESACQAADLLAQAGVRADVRSFPWLDPLDRRGAFHRRRPGQRGRRDPRRVARFRAADPGGAAGPLLVAGRRPGLPAPVARPRPGRDQPPSARTTGGQPWTGMSDSLTTPSSGGGSATGCCRSSRTPSRAAISCCATNSSTSSATWPPSSGRPAASG